MRVRSRAAAITVAIVCAAVAAAVSMHPGSRRRVLAVATRLGLWSASPAGTADDVVHVLVKLPFSPGALTAAEYDRRRRGRAIGIAGVDAIEGSAIPLFEVPARGLDAGDLAVPMLTDVLVRATIRRSALQNLPQEWRGRVFENVVITLPLPDPGRDTAIGTAQDVAERLDLAGLKAAGMTGKNVLVGVVDSGINVDVLKQRLLNSRLPSCGESPPCFDFDEDLSSGSSHVGTNPSNSGFTHGGMVAFDVMIAAPDVTFADIVLSGGGTARVADAIEAYITVGLKLALRRLDGKPMPLGVVLVNSWGILNPAKDDPGSTYVSNPNHVFAYVIGALADLGVDFVFAAGNCGTGGNRADCGKVGPGTIYGANAYERVVTVAAADVDQSHLDYSSQGPGLVFPQKPDVAGFAEFAGFHAVDSGTSAAAPTVAGLIAAYRSKHPFQVGQPTTSVDAMRDRIIRAVGECFAPGTRPTHRPTVGYGIVDGSCLVRESRGKNGSN